MSKHPSPNILSDGDASAVSELARRRRARTTVGDANDAYRAELVTAYHESRDDAERLALLAEAAEYGMAHPDEPSLVAEMRPRRRGVAA